MGQSERHGTKGKLWLSHEWEESSSTHVENYDNLYLEATPDEKGVMLVHARGQKNFIKNRDTEHQEEKYMISAAKLLELIREHGQKV